jgi:hypothetical protein
VEHWHVAISINLEVSVMPDSARILVVANQTAATPGLLEAVRERAHRGDARFHLVVPRRPHGLDKVLDPDSASEDEARTALAEALPQLSAAAGSNVTGSVGDPEPLMAIQDAIHLGSYDEIIISTLPQRVSRWLHVDLVSKTRGLGLPVTHVEARDRVGAGVT